MVMTAILIPMPRYPTGALIGPDASLLRSAHLLRRRAFERVLEQCDTLAGQGKDVVCPDINDPSAVRAFMRQDGEEVLEDDHAAAPPLLKIEDLSDQHLAVLRRMTRVGHCNEEQLSSLVPGMYELCVALVGPAGERGHMQRLLQRIEAPPLPTPTWTLQEYLDAFGGRVRPDR